MNAPPRIPGRRFLHSPGPTPVPDEVLHAMSRQPMDMGDPRVDAVIAACEQGLKRLLQTEAADVFFYAANGHGVWEAVVQNLIPPGGAALVPGTGHFSESWAVETEALGRRVVRTPWHEGLPIDPAAVTQALRDDREHEIAAVFVVHTDTSSGITSDLAALRAAMQSFWQRKVKAISIRSGAEYWYVKGSSFSISRKVTGSIFSVCASVLMV